MSTLHTLRRLGTSSCTRATGTCAALALLASTLLLANPAQASEPPPAPTNVNASTGVRSTTLTWTPEGNQQHRHSIQYLTVNSPEWVTAVDHGEDSDRDGYYWVRELTDNTTYDLRLQTHALNPDTGTYTLDSDWSTPVTVTTVDIPSIATVTTTSGEGHSWAATVTMSTPLPDSHNFAYEYQARPTGGDWSDWDTDYTPYEPSDSHQQFQYIGYHNETDVEIRVRATMCTGDCLHNTEGPRTDWSTPVSVNYTGIMRPSKPQNFAFHIDDPNDIHITWDIPEEDGGSPITGYNLTLWVSGCAECAEEQTFNLPSDEQEYTLTDMPAGSYSGSIRAVNTEGMSYSKYLPQGGVTIDGTDPTSVQLDISPLHYPYYTVNVNGNDGEGHDGLCFISDWGNPAEHTYQGHQSVEGMLTPGSHEVTVNCTDGQGNIHHTEIQPVTIPEPDDLNIRSLTVTTETGWVTADWDGPDTFTEYPYQVVLTTGDYTHVADVPWNTVTHATGVDTHRRLDYIGHLTRETAYHVYVRVEGSSQMYTCTFTIPAEGEPVDTPAAPVNDAPAGGADATASGTSQEQPAIDYSTPDHGTVVSTTPVTNGGRTLSSLPTITYAEAAVAAPTSHGVIKFADGKSALTRVTRATLASFAKSTRPGSVVVVYGFASPEELRHPGARRLAMKRAVNTARYLRGLGVDARVAVNGQVSHPEKIHGPGLSSHRVVVINQVDLR